MGPLGLGLGHVASSQSSLPCMSKIGRHGWTHDSGGKSRIVELAISRAHSVHRLLGHLKTNTRTLHFRTVYLIVGAWKP